MGDITEPHFNIDSLENYHKTITQLSKKNNEKVLHDAISSNVYASMKVENKYTSATTYS